MQNNEFGLNNLSPQTFLKITTNQQNEIATISSKLKNKSFSPDNSEVFRAFECCDWNNIRVVIINNKPTANSDGLALSISRKEFNNIRTEIDGQILQNIFTTMIKTKQISEMPVIANLSCWAKQGILLLNCSLTSTYTNLWQNVTQNILQNLNNNANQIIFVTFGEEAENASKVITANQHKKIHCSTFADSFAAEVNLFITSPKIEWNIPSPVFLFTDGAASNNGKINAKASWAFLSCEIQQSNKIIWHETYTDFVQENPSNNRGELSAILFGLQHTIKTHKNRLILVVTDSKYSINAITLWSRKWIKENEIKKNTDLIYPAADLYFTNKNIAFIHTKSHTPNNVKEKRQFLPAMYWEGNNRADQACTKKLREIIQ